MFRSTDVFGHVVCRVQVFSHWGGRKCCLRDLGFKFFDLSFEQGDDVLRGNCNEELEFCEDSSTDCRVFVKEDMAVSFELVESRSEIL